MSTATLIGRPDYAQRRAQQLAFYAGYDAFRRARWAHDRAWAEPWLEAAHAA